MHLILLLHPRKFVKPELTEFALRKDNPRGRLFTHRATKISIANRDDIDPALFMQGTLYAYVDVVDDNGEVFEPDPRATMRIKDNDLYPVISSLGGQVGSLYARDAIQVIPPVPVDLVVLKARLK